MIEVFHVTFSQSGGAGKIATRLAKAQEEMGYAMFRVSGKSDVEARALAHALYSGAAGQLLLRMAFSGDRHD